jgi:hypothetical protein
VRVIVALMSVVLLAASSCGGSGCPPENLLGCGDEPQKTPTQFLLGYAEVDVTPPLDTVMAAYGPPGGYRRTEGTHDPLLAQIAVIANDADQAFVLVTFDGPGFMYDFDLWGPGIKQIREAMVEAVKGKLVLHPGKILFTSSHSHAGPDLIGAFQPAETGAPKEYLAALLADIPAGLAQAVDGMRPGTLHFTATELVGYTGRDGDPPCSDVIDNSVTIMQGRTMDGTPLFTAVNYAKHPTMLGSDNHLNSADFIWGLREELKLRTGAPGMYIQGGEAAVHGGSKGASGTDEFDRAYNMGKIIADAVEAALPNLEPSVGLQIRHAAATTTCELKSELMRAMRENMGIPLRKMHFVGEAMWVDEVPVSWHQVGDAELAGMPGEATPELALLSKSKMIQPHKFFVGIANDQMGYILDKESLDKDLGGQLIGYEATMGMGVDSGQCVWDAHTALGWFDGAFVVP